MPRPPLLIIGHRGARALAPENTLLGLDVGIQAGASWLEFDVQRHPCGELFLLHDLTLDRTCNGKGVATTMPWPELRQLSAGKGQKIPTLDEALDLIDDRAGINIELKTWDGTAAAVAECLQARLNAGIAPERFLVSSFHLPELFAFKQLLPSIPVAALFGGVPLDYAASCEELQAVGVNLSAEFVDRHLVADAKKRGLNVWVYTVNTRHEAQYLYDLGVDGVFTDLPDRLTTLTGGMP